MNTAKIHPPHELYSGLDAESARLGNQAVRAATVLSSMAGELIQVNRSDGFGTTVCQALAWASLRTLHWVRQAGRCGQESARLKCLAEAACANMAFRGLVYEEGTARSLSVRKQRILLTQSRRLGGMIGRLCESTGRQAARDGFGPGEGEPAVLDGSAPVAGEAPACFRR